NPSSHIPAPSLSPPSSASIHSTPVEKRVSDCSVRPDPIPAAATEHSSTTPNPSKTTDERIDEIIEQTLRALAEAESRTAILAEENRRLAKQVQEASEEICRLQNL